MPRHHLGSGRRQVIPEDWSAHHRGVVNGTHTATVTLRRPGSTGGTFDRNSGTYTGATPYAAYYTGLARIQVMPTVGSDQVRAVAEQDVSTLAYTVLLNDAVDGVQLKDVITVADVDDNGDQDLIGAELIVSSIESGSLHWERKLVAILDLETDS
jgi:hypothetical protein